MYNLRITVQFVPSTKNKADVLTRVPQAWLHTLPGTGQCATVAPLPSVQEIHEQHHFGVRRTLQLARQVHPQATRQQIQQVVRNCVQCARIDPAPVRWHNGRLEVPDCWSRLAVDVTHHGRDKYLSVIDCGPSRFTIWRRISSEDAPVLANSLESIFVEFGPPAQILLDNSTSFRSAQMRHLAEKWGIYLRFRCAYRPSGNGIVERIHRTIKRTAARAESSIKDAVFWYNAAPLANGSSPSSILLQSGCEWRNPNVPVPAQPPLPPVTSFSVGDQVYVKPPDARCHTPWMEGRVTAIISDTAVEVNGVPRHVAECRCIPDFDNGGGGRVIDRRDSDDSDTDTDIDDSDVDEGDDNDAEDKEPGVLTPAPLPLALRRGRRPAVDLNKLIDR